MDYRLLDDGSAEELVTMHSTSLHSTQNSTSGYISLLRTPTIFLPLTTRNGTPIYATTPDYSYNGCEPAVISSTPNTTNKPDVAWKQQSKEGMVLQSVTMPIKNFFLLSLLTPTHSYYPLPHHLTGTLLNCQP
jgi:hypothetical protein